MFNLSNQIDAIKSSMIGYILMMASAIIGLIWVSISLYSMSVRIFGPAWGPALVGLLFLLPIVVYSLSKLLAPKDKRSRQQRLLDEAYAASPAGALSRMIETMSGHSVFLGTVTAIVGGFIAARFPQYLTILAELVSAGSEELKRQRVKKPVVSRRKDTNDGTPPPPPDVEPVIRRRRKKAEYDY